VDGQLHIRLLGDFALSLGESPVAADGMSLRATSHSGRRLQSLLVYLLLHSDAPQPRQHIAFLMWPDSSEEQALANLRTLLFHLRHDLPSLVPYVRVDRNTLQWYSDDSVEIDIFQFEQVLAQADQAEQQDDTHAQVQHLQNAVDLYRGDLLPSFYEEWILTRRETLQQRFASALETLITLLERQGNMQGAIGAAQRLLRHNPLHEAIYTRLMELYAATGMVAEALRLYHTCATTLERELGVEPGATTREVYERLLSSRQPVRLQTTQYQPTERQVSHAESGEPIVRQEAHTEPRLRSRLTLEQPALRVVTPLAGRAREWALLQEAWREIAQGRMGSGARAVLIRGEAGIGKTRLVEELFNWVTRQGVAVASARCYPIETQLAFGPVSDWLRALPISHLAPVWLSEIARLRPAILEEFPDIPAPGPLTEAWQRRRFMEAISRILMANRPLLLTLDDLQWCDLDTLEYLHFLTRAQEGDPHDTWTRALLVMTARIEEIDSVRDAARADYLAHLLDSLRDTDSLLEIDLMPLGREDTRELAAALSGDQGLDSPRISELYRETEGNPLFIVEMLRTGWPERVRNVEFGMRNTQPDFPHSEFYIPHSEGLPPRIARVLKARLGQLSNTARDLVDFAAVLGRDFTLPLLRLASNESESTVVQAIDEMWRRRIVREQG